MNTQESKSNAPLLDFNWGSKYVLSNKQVDTANNIAKLLHGFTLTESVELLEELKIQLGKISVIQSITKLNEKPMFSGVDNPLQPTI